MKLTSRMENVGYVRLVEIQRAFGVAKRYGFRWSLVDTGRLQRPSLADGLDQCRGVQLHSRLFVIVCVLCFQGLEVRDSFMGLEFCFLG